MKKYLLILLMCVIITGCGTSKEEKLFKEYASDYYNNYMKDIKMDSYQVTLEMLKNSNEQKITNYDLSELNKCDDESYVNISIVYGKESYEFDLNCK